MKGLIDESITAVSTKFKGLIDESITAESKTLKVLIDESIKPVTNQLDLAKNYEIALDAIKKDIESKFENFNARSNELKGQVDKLSGPYESLATNVSFLLAKSKLNQ